MVHLVARVVALYRYPVKSMAGCAVDAVDVSWNGLDGDRRHAFVREHQERNGFPWLTLRERSDMNRYRPSFAEPHRPNESAVQVQTPSGRVIDVTDPELAAELGDVRVIKQNRGVFDTMPLSLITTQTIASLAARVGASLDVQRFRPNLVAEATSDAPFPEDEWVGRVLRVGRARMRVDKRDQRCVIVNIDPATGARDAEILRAIARERASYLGVYGTTVEPGRVAVGDEIAFEED